eukprot:3525944-Heterocapsa_arctica.AAC.1
MVQGLAGGTLVRMCAWQMIGSRTCAQQVSHAKASVLCACAAVMPQLQPQRPLLPQGLPAAARAPDRAHHGSIQASRWSWTTGSLTWWLAPPRDSSSRRLRPLTARTLAPA